MSNSACKYPIVVALSEKFLWEVFLSEKWDHLFKGYIPHLPDLLPRNLSFCPVRRSWHDVCLPDRTDHKVIAYFEPSVNAQVTVRMRKEITENGDVPTIIWYPDSLHISVPILNQQLIKKHKLERVITEDFIYVENKK